LIQFGYLGLDTSCAKLRLLCTVSGEILSNPWIRFKLVNTAAFATLHAQCTTAAVGKVLQGVVQGLLSTLLGGALGGASD
jgi:hypothetical protein